MNSGLPDFICIGGQKAGTTWLYSNLKNHPEIFLPETKELNFFYSDAPELWYRDQFASAESGKVKGDISPNYFALPGVAERMQQLVPDCRIICLLREPVSRAISQLAMAKQLGNIKPHVSLQEAFDRNLQYLRERGEYAQLLERFLPYWRLQADIGVFFYDELLASPATLFENICHFLKVDPKWKPADLDTRVGSVGVKEQHDPQTLSAMETYYSEHNHWLTELLGIELPSSWRYGINKG